MGFYDLKVKPGTCNTDTVTQESGFGDPDPSRYSPVPKNLLNLLHNSKSFAQVAFIVQWFCSFPISFILRAREKKPLF